jgi:hypothetical protein
MRRAEHPAARGQDSDGHRDDRHGRRCLYRGAAAKPVKSEVSIHGKASGIERIKDPRHHNRQLVLRARRPLPVMENVRPGLGITTLSL